MPEQKFRRILDSMVKTSGKEHVSVDVFLSDNGIPLNLTTVCRLPERRIVEARVEAFWINGSGSPKLILKDLPGLTGIEARMGYIKNIQEALEHQNTLPLLDVLVESARMLVQIGMIPPDQVDGMDISDPLVLRRLDLIYWPELEEGCLPYAKAMEHLFESHGLRSASRLDIYAPRPRQNYRFRRDKVMECRLSEGVHCLNAHLSDDLHELEVQIDVSPGGRRVQAIHSRSIRAPYPGICNLPFHRTSQLDGVSIDPDLKQRVVDAVGGKRGCVHLTDLILDLMRYYKRICENPDSKNQKK